MLGKTLSLASVFVDLAVGPGVGDEPKNHDCGVINDGAWIPAYHLPPSLEELAPLYHVRKDAYFWRMVKVAGHQVVGLREILGLSHDDMAEPALPLVAELIAQRTATADATAPVWKSGTHHLTFDGRKRKFILDVPPGLRPGSPMVMVFHGFTGSAKDVRELTGFAKVSEQQGFVAVYPQGTRDSKGKSFFNVGYEFHRDQSVDDVQFARLLAARLTRDLGLDPRAVFATGYSNGGDLSFLLGAQREPFVAAIAPVAGTMMESWAKGFQPAARISVLAVNTRDDKTTLWDGDMNNRDGWGAYLGTEAVLDLWVKGLALERGERSNLTPTIQLRRWTTARDPTEARLYVLEVGGHHWPTTVGGERATTAEVIWRFFDAHRSNAR